MSLCAPKWGIAACILRTSLNNGSGMKLHRRPWHHAGPCLAPSARNRETYAGGEGLCCGPAEAEETDIGDRLEEGCGYVGTDQKNQKMNP